MRILIACEESQAVCIEFRKLGHEAYSCDVQECSGGHPEWHIQGDVLEILDEHYLCGCGYRFQYDLGKYGCPNCCGDKIGKLFIWDMMLAFPPCTYLTVTANKWLKDQPPLKSGALVGKERREARRDAIDFFMCLVNAPIKKIAIENPVGCMSSEWRPPDQIIQPYYFGDEYRKTTCLWLKNIPHLYHNDKPNLFDTKITHVSQGESAYWTDSKTGKQKRQPAWYASAKQGKNLGDRSKERSKTFPGIAKAMAKQWG